MHEAQLLAVLDALPIAVMLRAADGSLLHANRATVRFLARLGLEPDQVVDVVSEWTDGSERVARDYRVVPYPTPRGCAAAYYPECNVLVPLDAVAMGSNQPASKSVVVRFEPPGTTTSHGSGGGAKAGSDHAHRSNVQPTHLS